MPFRTSLRRHLTVLALLVATLAVAVPAYAAAPTASRLRAALLTPAQMSGWDRSSLPAPARKTFCNVDRHVAWKAFAGAAFTNRAHFEIGFTDALIAYADATGAHRAYREVKAAAARCSSYPTGGSFTTYISHVAAPSFGTEGFAIVTKDWNHVGTPYFCYRAVIRREQVNLAAGYCTFARAPSRTTALRFIKKAFDREVSVLG